MLFLWHFKALRGEVTRKTFYKECIYVCIYKTLQKYNNVKGQEGVFYLLSETPLQMKGSLGLLFSNIIKTFSFYLWFFIDIREDF